MDPSDVRAGIRARFAQIAAGFIFQAAILFLGSGQLRWAGAWTYLLLSLASVSVNAVFLLRRSPEMIAERGRPKEMSGWDKLLGGAWAVAQLVVLPLVASLDVRFGWGPRLATWWLVVGAAALVSGLALSGWAMVENAYFSTAVRIQKERGHTVCRTGPYRFVRHPGYVGFITQAFSLACVLGSVWSVIPAFASALALVVRTRLEDRLLQSDLPGYREYAAEVRYRLLPGVW